MRRIAFPTVLLLTLVLAGCGSMGGLKKLASSIFTSAKVSDATLEGFKVGEHEEVEEVAVIQAAAEALGLPESSAKLLDAVRIRVGVKNDAALREVVCIGPFAQICREILPNGAVHISGTAKSDGKIIPSRITGDRRP